MKRRHAPSPTPLRMVPPSPASREEDIRVPSIVPSGAALPDAVARQWLFRARAEPLASVTCNWRGSTGRSAIGCSCCRAGGRALTRQPRRARERRGVWHLALFLVGAIVMRGSGSTYNDIVDRDLDAKVERTRHRPVASGRVSVARRRACSWSRRRSSASSSSSSSTCSRSCSASARWRSSRSTRS